MHGFMLPLQYVTVQFSVFTAGVQLKKNSFVVTKETEPQKYWSVFGF